MKKILLVLLSISLLTACQNSNQEKNLNINQIFGNYEYKELYYVAILNTAMPDTIDRQLEKSPYMIIEKNQFVFQERIIKDVTYIEDEMNDEEEQLYFIKKYKVLDNNTDSYFRVYLTQNNVFIGVYYNTVSLRYIIKLK